MLLLEKKKISSGGLRNDCKQNYTYPVGFPYEHWSKEEADILLREVASHLHPKIEKKVNLEKYIAAFEECLEVSGDQLETLEYQGVGSWDSVGHMSLMAALEDAFDIMLDTDDIIDFSSFQKGKAANNFLPSNNTVDYLCLELSKPRHIPGRKRRPSPPSPRPSAAPSSPMSRSSA